MAVLTAGETLIDSETDVTGGDVKSANDAFDLKLVKVPSGDYRLIVFMKLQFFFADGNGGKWTDGEKNKFVRDWKTAIKRTWGNRIIKTLSGGKKVTLDFRFEIQIGGWMLDHWEITVTKVKKFRSSYVNKFTGNVTLDSLDLQLKLKSLKNGGHRQRGAVHEFGHMLGLVDEYKKNSPHRRDYRSVMHSGESVLSRHDSQLLKWLNQALQRHGIK